MSTQQFSTSRAGLSYSYRIGHHPSPRLEPTLFLSGAFQTMDSWARFERAFAVDGTVLLCDPPGMGASDVLPPEFDIDFLAGCLIQVLDEVGLDRVNIVAASYGTPCAYRIARLYPDRVGRVVLAGTMKEIPAHRREAIARTVELAQRNDLESLASAVTDGLLCHDPERPIDRRDVAMRVLRAGLIRMSERERIAYAANTARLLAHPPLDLNPPIAGPEALVFTGEHDCFTTPEHCREMANAFERASFTTVLRADHLFHLQQFTTVRDLLLRFMAGRLVNDPVEGCSELVAIGNAHYAT